MTRVLVVDDSQFMRTVIASVLGDHGFDVRTASDGESAIEATVEHEPDVITMDVQMPGIDGIEAVEAIMRRQPTPIVMLSAYTEEGADATLDAIAHGAIDFVAKPGGEISTDLWELEDELVETLETVADVDAGTVAWNRAAAAARTAKDAEKAVLEARSTVAEAAGTRSAATSAGTEPTGAETDATPLGTEPRPDVLGHGRAAEPVEASVDTTVDVPDLDHPPTIVVGASTGGPRVVEQVLTALPAELDARVLVVQHMPESFTGRLAQRLDGISEYDVREADDGALLEGGHVLVARGGAHMEVRYAGPEHARVALTDDEPEHSVRPAIDVTMRTAAREVQGPLVGVALTGMGRDGAAGISAIKDAGGATIAQDEDSAPVYGIPRHAVATGEVDRVCSGRDVVPEIVAAIEEVSDDE